MERTCLWRSSQRDRFIGVTSETSTQPMAEARSSPRSSKTGKDVIGRVAEAVQEPAPARKAVCEVAGGFGQGPLLDVVKGVGAGPDIARPGMRSGPGNLLAFALPHLAFKADDRLYVQNKGYSGSGLMKAASLTNG